jgi:hypothetical protein
VPFPQHGARRLVEHKPSSAAAEKIETPSDMDNNVNFIWQR